MSVPVPPRRSWFAVWRWRWQTWGILILAFFPLYLASEPLASHALYAMDSRVQQTLAFGTIYNWSYAPVNWARSRFPAVQDFLTWESHVIAGGRQQWFFFWNPPEPAPPLPP